MSGHSATGPAPSSVIDPALPVPKEDLVPEERRAQPRFAFDALVTLGSETCFTHGCAENLSGGGIFIATLSPPAVGETVAVRIRVERESCPALVVVGRIVWHRTNALGDPTGCGIAFEIHNPALQQAIDDMIAKLDRTPLLWDM